MQVTREHVINTILVSALVGAFTQLVTLLVLPVFVANLGGDLYGIWVVAATVTGYLGLFEMGFGAGLGKYIAKGIQHRQEDGGRYLQRVLGTGLTVLTVSGVLNAFVVISFRQPIVAFFDIALEHRAIATNLLVVAGISCLLVSPLKIASICLDAAMQVKINRVLLSLQGLCCAISMLVLAWCSLSPVVMMVANSVIALFYGVLTLVIALRRVPRARFRYGDYRHEILKEVTAFGLHMFYLRSVSSLSSKIDVIVIARLLSVAAVTPYVVATSPFKFVSTALQQFIGNIVLPTVYNLDARNERLRIAVLLQQAIKYRMIAVIPIVACGLVYIPTFLRLWMGEEYVQYSGWAQLILLCHLSTAFGFAISVGMGTGQQWLVVVVVSLRVLLNLMVSVATVPVLGIGGPLVGTLTGHLIAGDPLLFGLVAHRGGIPTAKTYRSCLGMIVVGCVFTVFLFALETWLPPAGWISMLSQATICAAGMYAVLVVIFFDDEEKKDMRRVVMGLMNYSATRARS